MDVEKTIEFILEQQAQLATGLNQLSSGLNQLNSVVLEIATAQERTNAIVATLAEQHVDLAERHLELAEQQAELRAEWVEMRREFAEQHKITEQNLNALILTVERHIASHN